jgi:1,4-alpha-glucan branching enzyme
MTFGLVYAFSENFVLPLSHDEVVHGKGSILARMPGDEWQRFANLRAYYGFMWGHPGKKLLFMGQEFAQGTEWSHDSELPWWLLQYELHQGVMQLVRDLNRVYRNHTPLHQLDCSAQGFEWIDAHDAESSVLSWLRKDAQGAQVLVVSHMTPLTRVGYRLGVPEGPRAWRVILNTDAACYGGSNFCTGDDPCPVQAAPAHGRAQSIELNLPPLATLYLVPA